jgi:LPXTG-site transpeptidase (sortase) family protein
VLFRWLHRLANVRVWLLILGALGFAWGFVGLARPALGAETAWATVPPASPTAAGRALKGELPKAWATPTLIPSPTTTPSPSPTATHLRRATSVEASPSPTLSPTPTLTPSPRPTPTPIHYPADGDPTRITAPAIGLDAKVVTVRMKEYYEGGVLKRVWEVADYAAGFHEGMARPGHVGNTVIAGHHNVRGKVFQKLHLLKPGDDVFVWVGHSPYRYRVDTVYRLPVKGVPPEVLESNLRFILPTDDQRLTLVTCWPAWGSTHRTVVVAYPAPWDP